MNYKVIPTEDVTKMDKQGNITKDETSESKVSKFKSFKYKKS